jgi:hypothetical protein
MEYRPSYEIIVVGAGISGLYATRELLRQYPGLRIALAERYKGFGGRTYSYSPKGREFEGIHWEMGAGRIHKDHKLIMGLLKEYGLTWVPISSDMTYLRRGEEPVPNLFDSIYIPVFIKPLLALSPGVLATHTLQELMIQVHGPEKTAEILSHFPYRAEVNTMRADIALKGFIGGEMGTNEGYGIIKEGFSELVARMRLEVEARGAILLPRHRLINLEAGPGSSTYLEFQFGREGHGEPHGKITLRAEKAAILALHKDAVAELPAFRGWKTLGYLKTQPLLRTYMIFATSAKSPVWFSDLKRVVTADRPRYILPMNTVDGTIMISYTDGDNTEPYMTVQKEKGDKALSKMILGDIRKLFSGRQIPDPVFFKSHPWETGCTYWIPGGYSAEFQSKAAIHPFPAKMPSVWLCGESWSMRQCWVEGALEQTVKMLGALNF